MGTGEGREGVALQEVEDALAEKIGDDTDVIPIVEALLQVYAPVPVRLVVLLQCRKYPQLYS